MINIAICEDDPIDRKILLTYMDEIMVNFPVAMNISYLDSGFSLISSINNGANYSLVILDIMMEGLNGIETARHIKEIQSGVLIGFLTYSKEYAIDAFDLNALHYLIKPVTKEKMLLLLERFVEHMDKPVKMLELMTPSGSSTFPLTSILRIESYKKGVSIYFFGDLPMQWLRVSFMSVEDQLAEKNFIRISRGLIVNMEYIKSMKQGICYFSDGTSALISRREQGAVRKLYNDYLFERMKKAGV